MLFPTPPWLSPLSPACLQTRLRVLPRPLCLKTKSTLSPLPAFPYFTFSVAFVTMEHSIIYLFILFISRPPCLTRTDATSPGARILVRLRHRCVPSPEKGAWTQ